MVTMEFKARRKGSGSNSPRARSTENASDSEGAPGIEISGRSKTSRKHTVYGLSSRTHVASRRLRDSAADGDGEHESCNAAEDHAHADQRAEQPRFTRRPRADNKDRQRQGDNPVEEQPSRSGQRPEHVRQPELQDPLEEQ